jgi:hypothetical protein
MIFCPPSGLINQSTKAVAIPLLAPNAPTSACAGLSNGSFSSSVASACSSSQYLQYCTQFTGELTKTSNLSVTSSSIAHHVPRSTMVYSPSLLATLRAWKGKSMNWWYQDEYGWDQGVWPIVVQILASQMLLADLSELCWTDVSTEVAGKLADTMLVPARR